MKKLFTILILLTIFVQISFAQQAMIKGRIVDTENKSVPFASVRVSGMNVGTTSDVDGYYTLRGLSEGSHTVDVSYIGFKPQSQSIEVKANAVLVLNFTLQAGIDIEEIVVTSRLTGESKALNSQKNNVNITNVIAAEQIERFPDANIGDGLKRMTGINVQYDQGEARFGNIRGTSPNHSSFTINGERVPSAEAEVRSVQLDLIPADMIQSIQLNKALTPDMDADAIGGSINLTTISAPSDRQIMGRIATGWNVIAEKPSLKGNISISDRFFNNKLGVVVSASLYDNKMGSDNMEAEWDYVDDNDNGKYDGNEKVYTTNFQNRQYYVERFRQSYSAAIDYDINDNHKIYVKGMFNKRQDWENRFRSELKNIEYDVENNSYSAELRRQTKFGVKDNKYCRLEDQRMNSISFGGNHDFRVLTTQWSVALSNASEERPHERYITYRAKNVGFGMDLSDMEKPKINFDSDDYSDFSDKMGLKELTEQYQYTEEKDFSTRINFEMPLVRGAFANTLKFGAAYKSKDKMRDNWLKTYEPTESYEDQFDELVLANLKDISNSDFMAGDYKLGNFTDPKISDKINLYDEANFESEFDIAEEAGDFDANEKIAAGYLMLTQQFGDKITLVAGLRAEKTDIEYKGKIYDYPTEDEQDAGIEPSISDTEKKKKSYTKIFPGLHFKYAPNKMSNIRFAWTNTLARPDYYDLVPYQEINRDDSELALGNPDLKPTLSMNFDIMGEYFFQTIGLVSAGVFHKQITDVVAFQAKNDYEYKGNVYENFQQPINAGDAELSGIEISIERRLNFLPSFLRNFSIYANYTYIKSEMKDINIEDRQDDKLPLCGSPKNTYNVSLAYDSKRLEARLSFNHADAFLNVNEDGGFGTEAFYDLYYDAVNYMDFNASFKINKNMTVFGDATNLLNQPLRTYFGDSKRTAQAEYYGSQFKFGMKFKF